MKKVILILLMSLILFVVFANKDCMALGLLSFFAAVCSLIYLIYVVIRKVIKGSTTKSITIEIPANKLLSSNFADGTYYTKIAGVQHHSGKQDIGGFLGYVCSEPNNPYDKNAIAIYRNDNKLLGYIPKDETADFRKWSDKENLPCIGFIKAGDEVPRFGKVKIIDTDKDEVDLIVAKYVRWLISNFGTKFIPNGFSVGTDKELQTKTDWIDFLDGYIEEKETELYEKI